MLFLSLENGDACVLLLPDGSTGHVTRTPNGIAFHLEDDILILRSELLFAFGDAIPGGDKWDAIDKPKNTGAMAAYWDALTVRAANQYDVRRPDPAAVTWLRRPWPEDNTVLQYAVTVIDDSEFTCAWEKDPRKRPRTKR